MVQRKTGVDKVRIVRKVLASGTVRWFMYAWRGGPLIRSADGARPVVTQEDMAAIAKACEAAKPANQETIRGLVASYRSDSNPDWKRLAPATRKLWGDCLDTILTKWGDVPLRMWNDPRTVARIVAWRDSMAATPRKADNHISTLSRLLEFGRLRARVTVNVASGIPTLYRGAGKRAAIIWTPDDMEKVAALVTAESERKLAADGKMRDVTPAKRVRPGVWDGIRLASLTGLRRADLVAVGFEHVGDNAITFTASKVSRGKRYKVTVPILPSLRRLLAELKSRYRKPGVTTLLVNSFGDSWTGDGFGTAFHEDRRDADIHYVDDFGNKNMKRLHDLRGTFATFLMTEAFPPLTNAEIGRTIGWSPEQVEEIRVNYVDTAKIVLSIADRLANAHGNQGGNQAGTN